LIAGVVFGAFLLGGGSFKNLLRNSKAQYKPAALSGVIQNECEKLLIDFFAKKRRLEASWPDF
jgi:tRNA(Arg) A34 adenosine deaminase TadA